MQLFMQRFNISVWTLRLTLVEVDAVFSVVDDVSQGAQDEWVNIIVKVNFWVVVLHRKDAVNGNTNFCTEPLHLHLKKKAVDDDISS